MWAIVVAEPRTSTPQILQAITISFAIEYPITNPDRVRRNPPTCSQYWVTRSTDQRPTTNRQPDQSTSLTDEPFCHSSTNECAGFLTVRVNEIADSDRLDGDITEQRAGRKTLVEDRDVERRQDDVQPLVEVDEEVGEEDVVIGDDDLRLARELLRRERAALARKRAPASPTVLGTDG